MLFGFILGAAAASAFYLLLSRRFLCRLGWHKWQPWAITGDGAGQFRTCDKCALFDVSVFHGFTVRRDPIRIPASVCADCFDTGFKVTDGKAGRCTHEAQPADAQRPLNA